ncbi:MAG: hypothetical protein WBJ21_00215 [Burkholderiaceae bacterium]
MRLFIVLFVTLVLVCSVGARDVDISGKTWIEKMAILEEELDGQNKLESNVTQSWKDFQVLKSKKLDLAKILSSKRSNRGRIRKIREKREQLNLFYHRMFSDHLSHLHVIDA